jgi:hypothetical protein
MVCPWLIGKSPTPRQAAGVLAFVSLSKNADTMADRSQTPARLERKESDSDFCWFVPDLIFDMQIFEEHRRPLFQCFNV